MLRFEPGEELYGGLSDFCRERDVHLASIHGIGAARRIRVGVYDPAEQRYHERTFEGDFEITSLAGNITHRDGAPFAHVHINFADTQLNTRGGHLFEAEISLTCEVVLHTLPGVVDRVHAPATGLFVLDL